MDSSELEGTIYTILDDYDSLLGPFDENILPEKKVIRDIEGEKEKSLFLTLTASVDYRKETEGENGLWKTSKRLWERENWVFRPDEVAKNDYSELIDLFEDAGWNWKDPHIWYRISLTLYRRFKSNPLNLIEENKCDAVKIQKYMRKKHSRKFPYLKGDKINSLWLRLMHEEIRPLSRIEEIALPVDTHITSITNYLLGKSYSNSKDEKSKIRQFWRSFCRENGIVPVRLDQPLWLIHKHWQNWGREYLAEIQD